MARWRLACLGADNHGSSTGSLGSMRSLGTQPPHRRGPFACHGRVPGGSSDELITHWPACLLRAVLRMFVCVRRALAALPGTYADPEAFPQEVFETVPSATDITGDSWRKAPIPYMFDV